MNLVFLNMKGHVLLGSPSTITHIKSPKTVLLPYQYTARHPKNRGNSSQYNDYNPENLAPKPKIRESLLSIYHSVRGGQVVSCQFIICFIPIFHNKAQLYKLFIKYLIIKKAYDGYYIGENLN